MKLQDYTPVRKHLSPFYRYICVLWNYILFLPNAVLPGILRKHSIFDTVSPKSFTFKTIQYYFIFALFHIIQKYSEGTANHPNPSAASLREARTGYRRLKHKLHGRGTSKIITKHEDPWWELLNSRQPLLNAICTAVECLGQLIAKGNTRKISYYRFT